MVRVISRRSAAGMVTAACFSIAMSMPASANDCPAYPSGISRPVIDGRRTVVSVAMQKPLSADAGSVELALATAALEARYALAKAVSPDGRTLSGVSDLFRCVSPGKAFAGVMMLDQAVTVPAGDGARVKTDKDELPPQSASFPPEQTAGANSSLSQRGARPRTADDKVMSIGRSIRENPTPVPETTDYEIIFPDGRSR